MLLLNTLIIRHYKTSRQSCWCRRAWDGLCDCGRASVHLLITFI